MNFDISKLSPSMKARNPQLFENIEGLKKKSNSKYRNQRGLYNGVWYDSVLEAKVAADLDLGLKAGIYTEVKRQVPFKVGDVDKYILDFVVTVVNLKDNHGFPQFAVDAKGFPTPKFRRDLRWCKLYFPMPLVIWKRNGRQVIISELLKRKLNGGDDGTN